MSEITDDELKDTIQAMARGFDECLYAKEQGQLEDYWHFRYDNKQSKAQNLYEFTSALELYKHFCCRWEEHHNGSCCVEERVGDTYLVPKIKEFVREFENHE